MSRALRWLVLALLLASCAHEDLKAPCRHPALTLFADDCGPLRPVQ